MLENIPRISVLVITYNQENVISRAIESLLAQKDYIYEICVSDDCSKDKTWEILQDYDRKYPGLFVLNRNETNIGIFENIEKNWEMPSGDIIYGLAGDDECGEGWLKTVIDFIKIHQINYKDELFCIYGDYEIVTRHGAKRRIKNESIQNSHRSALSLTLTGELNNRSTCYSINILRKFFKVSQGRSHIAESIQDCELQIFTEKNYYIPFIGNRYYTNIGVSSNLNMETLKEREQMMSYALAIYAKMNIRIGIREKCCLRSYQYSVSYKIHKDLISFFKWHFYGIMGLGPIYIGNYIVLAFDKVRRVIGQYNG